MNGCGDRIILLLILLTGALQARAADPAINQQPQDQTVIQGANATFTVAATGTGPLTYQWWFNQTNLLAAQTNSSLTISNAQAVDQGGYSVVVTNSVGSINSQIATLTVLIRPVITIQPQNLTVAAGEDATFSVTVTNIATLPINYQWRKSTTSLTNLLLNATTCSFTLFNVQTNSTPTSGPGSYRVVISNAATPVSLVASPLVTLTVVPAVLPAVATGAASQITDDGANLNGSVQPNGSRSFGWFQYGPTVSYGAVTPLAPVGNGTNFVPLSLPANGLTPLTTYHFRLIATNTAGLTFGDDQTFTTTGVAPIITQQPLSLVTNQGSNVTFTVAATGTAPLSYQWLFNGTNLLAGATNLSLNLTNVQDANAGTYLVVIANSFGSVTSQLANLTVLIRPAIAIQPQNVAVAAGENATFSVTVTNTATLPINYQWRKGAIALTNLLLNARTSSFTLYNVQTNSTATSGPGGYRVVISNAATPLALVGSSLATLTVLPAAAPAVLTSAASDIAGDGATFNGTVNPNGATTTAWFEYGSMPSYGSSTLVVSLGNGTNAIPVNVAVGGLAPGTAYHFRLVATNRSGLASGDDQMLSTLPTSAPVPLVTTLPADNVAIASAILNATINPNGDYAGAYFEYGLTTNYGAKAAVPDAVHGGNPITVSARVDSLGAGVIYHYRAAAFNFAGTNFGADQMFKTPEPPDVATLPPGLLNTPDVVLRGSINPNGSANLTHFEYGLTTNYGSSTASIDVGNGAGVILVSNVVAGLLGYTNYHYRIVAINAAGALYGADQSFTFAAPQPYTFTTFAGKGGGFGSSDGVGDAAGFYYPAGVAVDNAGNVYVADSSNETIRKVTPGGVVSTFAGLAGHSGCADGVGGAARFYGPEGVAVDSVGNVYVADSFNNTIRKITPGGLVTTLAGVAMFVGSSDGPGSAARFKDPRGVAVDSAGNVYVADSGNLTIRKITPRGVVSTLAGMPGVGGSTDGTGSAARFGANPQPDPGRTGPVGLAVDTAGNVYVADTYNSTIRKITPGGVVSTFAGSAGNAGFANGPGNAARFFYPSATAVDSVGNVYVADTDNDAIRKITALGVVSTLAGPVFGYPHGVAVDTAGNVYVGDFGNLIREITPGGVVTTLAGSLGNPGNADGNGSSARFGGPWAAAVGSSGIIYVADRNNSEIRKITPNGQVTTLAGSGFGGTNDGIGRAAQFWYPSGVAVDRSENLYIADSENYTIRKITPQGVVTTFAGLAGAFGSQDGTGSDARFSFPVGIAVDSAGTVYVVDSNNSTVRKITPNGMVSTLAGKAGILGSEDGVGSAARFHFPYGAAVDSAGNVYVADNFGCTIRKITPAGVVSTLAGLSDIVGSDDGTGSAARFYYPAGVAVDGAGNVFVADTDNSIIRKITPTGTVVTIGGFAGRIGFEDGTGSDAHFNNPYGLAVDSAGIIYVMDTQGNTIRRGTPTPIFITQQPNSQAVFQGGAAAFNVQASSVLSLSYQWSFNGTAIAGATNADLFLNNVSTSQAGNYFVVIGSTGGAVTSSVATLTVISGAPSLSITAQPQSQTVSSNANATLSVTATGNPAPHYQWRRNGVNIPGAINATYTIIGAQPIDGGRYTVIVSSLAGAITSDPADVIVTSPSLVLADNFANRVIVNSVSGVGSGSNTNATSEPGETNHVGKVGGKSVWFGWRAPVNGIATFSTLGSGFDTLLAVYTGSSVTNLTWVVSDDDVAGFLNSQVSFQATAGTVYNVAIDGFAGGSGNIVLSWSMDITVTDFPQITTQPLSQTVTNGATVFFSVVVASQSAASYYWLFNCEVITNNPTANNATLIISNVQPALIGTYTVRINNAIFRTVESHPAFLEIGGQPDAKSQDKLEDLLSAGSGASLLAAQGKGISTPVPAPNGFVSVAAGTIGSQLLNNLGATTQQGESNHCGVIGGSSKWFGLQAADDGSMVVDTIGSAIDTVLAVYTGTNLFNLTLIDCDNNSAPDGVRSLVKFSAHSGTKYLVAVDGVNLAQGPINLNWSLGTVPQFTPQPPTNETVHLGGSLVLSARVTNDVPPASFQWRLNGHSIEGAIYSTLILNNLQASQAGVYSIVAANAIGAVTDIVAVVTVALPIHVDYELRTVNGAVQFRLLGPSSQGLVIESSSDLRIWTPRYTNVTSNLPLQFTDSDPAAMRFYRVMPWH